jgi:ergothioneine biosynthesis protein EgtB
MTLSLDNTALTRQFLDVRSTTDALTARLSAEDQTPQSMPDASPTKWHRAHTTWFFEEFLLRPDPSTPSSIPRTGIFSTRTTRRSGGAIRGRSAGSVTRPGIADIARYREYVQDAMVRALDAGRFDERAQQLVELGCHHEQQHQELLLMDIKHPVLHARVRPGVRGTGTRSRHPHRCVELAAGVGRGGGGRARGRRVRLRQRGPRHRVLLEDFQIAERAVTVADWLEFMADGGYRRADLWLSDGWARVQADGWDAPGYWAEQDGAWTTFTLSGRRPVVPAEAVCHVSFYEADAFARWAGARLPTEFEWEIAAQACRTVTGTTAGPGPGAPRPGRRGDGGRRVGVDLVGVPAVSRLRSGARCGRRIQRQVHV